MTPTDIVERLRSLQREIRNGYGISYTRADTVALGADEIDQLRARIAELEAGPRMTWETLDRLEKKMEKIEADTIERCAQVADTMDCDHKIGSEIAAAIRALKK